MGLLRSPQRYPGTITNHFYDGTNSPVRDAENELYKYFDAEGKTTLEGGSYFHDQVVCGSGYTEGEIDTNYAEAINNTFEGGLWTKATGGHTNITIRSGMRWGIVKNITNNFIKGDYYRFFGGCDYGRVLETATNNFGKELAEGEEAPVLTFSSYVFGGGNDIVDVDAKIAAAKAKDEADRTDTQKAWIAFEEKYGEGFDIGTEYIVNNIYYGTFHQFFGGSYGSNTETIHSGINTITNNIKGGTFDKLNGESTVYAGGCFRSAVIENGIINNVDSGTFNGNYYGGSVGTGMVSCPSITNNIDSFTGNKSANAFVYFGNGAPTFNGTVKTVINDFDAGKSYVMGGSTNVHNQPEGVDYGIETTINGGTFCGFWGLGGGSSCEYNGNVKTTVNGGTFNGYASNMPNSLAGGPRNGKLTGNIDLIINGGTFTANVAGSTIWGSYDACAKEIKGDINVTIKGGDFQGDIYRISRDPEAITCSGNVAINAEQTAGVALNLGGKVEFDSFVSNGEVIGIDAESNIAIKNLTGTLNLKQTEGWIAHDYLKLPAGSLYTIDDSEVAYGTIFEDDSILVKGFGFDVSGATIRLEEDLGIRFLFDPNYVDAYGDGFIVKVMLGDSTLTNADSDDLVMYQGYKSLIVKGIGLADFNETITVSGVVNEKAITFIDLVGQAKAVCSGEWLEALAAIENLNKVYNLGQASEMAPEAVTQVNTMTDGDAKSKVTSFTASLAMGDAVSAVFDVELSEIPETLVLKVNGEAVEGYAEVTSDKEKGTSTVKIDLPVKARYMEDMIKIELSSASGVYFTYDFSIAALTNALAQDTENVNATNASALLCYIQQAVDCVA